MFGGGLGAAERSTLIAYALMVLIGGGNTVAVRLSNFGLPPLWGVATRVSTTTDQPAFVSSFVLCRNGYIYCYSGTSGGAVAPMSLGRVKALFR